MNVFLPGTGVVGEQIRALYLAIRRKPGQTRQTLGQDLDLPATTLNRLIDPLSAAGLIETWDQAESTGGRRAGLLRTADGARRLVGLDIGPRDSQLLAFDLGLSILAQEPLPAAENWRSADPVRLTGQACRKLFDRMGWALNTLVGLGIVRDPAEQETASRESIAARLSNQLGCAVEYVSRAETSLMATVWRQMDPADDRALFACLDQSIRYAVVGDARSTASSSDPWRLLDFWLAGPEQRGRLVPLADLATSAGMLARFRALKSDSELSSDDWLRAVRANKKKPVRSSKMPYKRLPPSWSTCRRSTRRARFVCPEP